MTSLGFILQAMRIVDWITFADASSALNLVIDAVLVPCWVLWLGVQLRQLSAGAGMYQQSNLRQSQSTPEQQTTPETPEGCECSWRTPEHSPTSQLARAQVMDVIVEGGSGSGRGSGRTSPSSIAGVRGGGRTSPSTCLPGASPACRVDGGVV
uniref:Uncharacterized protein n=1 Tax=Haptolina brevifila TaxID=156173 RepID=A0A7S2I9D6_9EUKA